MGRLIFNTGGQPIYLDDMQSLQAQITNLQRVVCRLLALHKSSPSNGTIWEGDVAILPPSSWDDSRHGFVIRNGEIISCYCMMGVAGDELNYTGAVRVWIHKNTTTRTMEDGTTKAVEESYSADMWAVADENDMAGEYPAAVSSTYIAHWRDAWVFAPASEE